MATVEERLAQLGRPLPVAPAPLAAYVPAVRTGSLVFTAGQLPLVDGALHITGIVGSADDIDKARECAAIAVVNAIAAIKTVVPDLSKITRIVKLTGFVAATPDFTAHPQVVNGASELLGQIWPESGQHARSAVGVASLPLGAPVEIELVVEVAD